MEDNLKKKLNKLKINKIKIKNKNKLKKYKI